jgi:PAS domain S-box-containing protein
MSSNKMWVGRTPLSGMSALVPYGWAVSTTAAALAIRLLLDPVLGFSIPYATFFLAVAMSSLLGGWVSGIIAALLGGISTLYFVIPPRHKPWLIYGADHQLGFALYLVISALLISLAEMQRRAKLRAEREAIERGRAEARERDEHQRFDITLASIGDGVISTDCEGRITFLNKVACELTGWSQADAVGQPIDRVFVIRDETTGAVVESPTTRALCERRIVNLTGHTALLSKNGSRRPIGDSGAPVFDATGQLVGAVLVFHDTSEQRAKDAELRQLKHMVELSQDAIIMTDGERRILSWNLGAMELYGWEVAEACGRVAHELLRTGALEVERTEQALRDDGSWEGELTHAHKDGRAIQCESRQVILLDSENSIRGMLEINRDVTERRRIEEKLRETAKLESLGILAGGIAHDFNNLLTAVLGNASLLLDNAPVGSPSWSFAKGICEAAEQAAKLAHQMLAYSGRGHFVIDSVDLSEFVRENAALLHSAVPKLVELVFDLATELPAIEADREQLRQVLMNLVVNGAEAIGDAGGRVTVTTRSQFVDEAYRRTLLHDEQKKPGLFAVLEVSDTGCGMDEQTMSRIFDPFFTTKFVGRGLGLSAVQGIARGHKGAMKVESRVGEGARFMVFFPAGVAAEAKHVPQLPDSAANVNGGTILVVDDEEVVRITAERILRRMGYDVLAVSDGAQGLEALRSLNDTIRLVLLDLSMPVMDGRVALREIRKIRPDVPVLLCSGFGPAEAMRQFGGTQEAAGFLQKPYTGSTLVMRARAAISRMAKR